MDEPADISGTLGGYLTDNRTLVALLNLLRSLEVKPMHNTSISACNLVLRLFEVGLSGN